MQILIKVTVGILTEMNELAARYGVEPSDFVAEVQPELSPNPALNGELDATGRTLLSYTIFPAEVSKRERFELMLETIGISASTGTRLIRAGFRPDFRYGSVLSCIPGC